MNFGTKDVNTSVRYEHDAKSQLWVRCVTSGYVAQLRVQVYFVSPETMFNIVKPTGYVMHQ